MPRLQRGARHVRGTTRGSPRRVPLWEADNPRDRCLRTSLDRTGDRVFGHLLDALERRGLATRTVVVLGADHGESLDEHYWFGHNRLWQSVLHTPLVVYVPGAPPRTIGEPVMNVDILPTVARLVGAPLPPPMRGRHLFGPRSADDVQYADYADSYALIRRGSKIRVLTGRKPPMSRPVGGTGAPQRVAGSAPHVDGLWG